MYGPDYAWIWVGKPDKIWWQDPYTSKGDRNRDTTSPAYQDDTVIKRPTNITTDQFKWGNSWMTGKEKAAANNTLIKKSKSHLHSGTIKNLDSQSQCSLKQLREAIEHTLVFDRVNTLRSGRKSDYGLVSKELALGLNARLKLCKSKLHPLKAL